MAGKDGGNPIHEEAEGGGISISVEPSAHSQVLREIAEGRITPVVQGRGADECIRLMNEGQIKVGRVVCMLRSNTHAVLKDGAHPEKLPKVQGLQDAGKTGDQLNDTLQQLVTGGRPYPYVHYAIYVGPLGDKHYVIENTGRDPTVENEDGNGYWGRVRLNDVVKSFNDETDDDSYFLILKGGPGKSTQQHALALKFDDFKYQYDPYFFNCEVFVAVCAGWKTDKDPVAYRVFAPDRTPEQQSSDEERRKVAQRYVKKMRDIWIKYRQELDKCCFELKFAGDDEREVVVAINNRRV